MLGTGKRLMLFVVGVMPTDSCFGRGTPRIALFAVLTSVRAAVLLASTFAAFTDRLRGSGTPTESALTLLRMALNFCIPIALYRLFAADRWDCSRLFPVTRPDMALPVPAGSDVMGIYLRREPTLPASIALVTLLVSWALSAFTDTVVNGVIILIYSLTYYGAPFLLVVLGSSIAHLCAQAVTFWSTQVIAGDDGQLGHDEWESHVLRSYLDLRREVRVLMGRLHLSLGVWGIAMIVGFTLSLLQMYLNVFEARRDNKVATTANQWTFAVGTALYVIAFSTSALYFTALDRAAGIHLREAMVSHTKRPLSHTSRLCRVMEQHPISFLVLSQPVTVSGVSSLAGLIVASVIPAVIKKLVS